MRALTLLVLLAAWPAPGVAQDKTGRVKVQMPWLSAPGYMQIGGIDGESRDEGHEEWIQVLSLDWGSSAAPSGPKSGAGDVVIQRRLDTSSPRLVETIGREETIPLVVLHAPGRADSSTYQAFELGNARITAYSVSTAGNVPMESITFHFEKIDIKDGPVLKGNKILQN